MKRIFKTFIVALCLTAVACTDYQVDIDDLNNRVDNLETSKIATIAQQIQSINASIPVLQSTSSELKTLVNSLKTTVEGYDAAIAENGEALAQLKSDIEKSIEEIKKSIEEGQGADKQEMLDALNAAKAEIEAQIAALQTDTQNKLDQMNEVVENLQEKDASIEARIDSLKIFVNEELVSQKDWATKTFATLQQQQAIQNDITSIKSDISSLQSALTALEDRITREYTAAINSAVASLKSEIAATANQITDAYKAAIATAKDEIKTAYEKAIEQAISDLETKLQGWVNEQLKGYYTTAEIKDKIDSLHGEINDQLKVKQDYIDALEKVLGGEELITKYNTDSKTIAGLIAENAADFTELYNALTKTKANMTNDEKALIDAIVADGGVINDLINSKITAYSNRLKESTSWINEKFTAIERRVTTLESEVDDLQEDVEALSSKLTGFINGRIQSLTYIPTTVEGDHWVGAVDDEAFGYIELTFRVSPASMVKNITKEQVSAKVYYPGYGMYGGYFPVTVQDIEYGKENYSDVIGVVIKAKDVFFDYNRRAAISVSVKDATNNYYDVASEFVTVNAEHYFIEYTSYDNDFEDNYSTFVLTDGSNNKAYRDWNHNGYNFVEVEPGTTQLTAKFNDNDIRTLKFGAYLDKSKMLDDGYGWDYDDWTTVQLTTGAGVFKGSEYLTSVDFGFGLSKTSVGANDEEKHRSGLGTKNVTSFASMFEGCKLLTDVDMTYCNTANVTTTNSMFDGCESLDTLNLSGWNTSKLVDATDMLQNCKNLKYVNLKGWNVSNVTAFTAMFDGCAALNKVDIDWTTFNTSPVSFLATFRGAGISSVNLDLPTITASSVVQLFQNCGNLKTVSLTPHKNNQGNIAATVTVNSNMTEMFEGCTELTSVDLSYWTFTGTNTVLTEMFNGCSKLQTIYLDGWKLPGDITITDMFTGCTDGTLKYVYLRNSDESTRGKITSALEAAKLTTNVVVY